MSIDLKSLKQELEKNKEKPTKRSLNTLLNKEIRFGFNKGLANKKKERFFNELGVLISSGIDIKSSFEIILDQTKKGKEKEAFHQIYEDVIMGTSLAEAIKKTGLFSAHDYYSIRVGEETGNLDIVMVQLGEFYNERIKQKRKIVNALSYPILVLIMTVLVVIFLMNFLIPMFQDIFAQSNKELPPVTRFVIHISDFFNSYFYIVVLFIIVGAGVMYYFRNNNLFKSFTSRLILKIPFIGKIVKNSNLNIILQSFSLLLSSNVTLMESIGLVKKMIRFYPFQQAFSEMENDLMTGQTFYQVIEKHRIFDRKMVSLIKVGEEVNELPKIFKRLLAQNQEDLNYSMNALNTFLEPFLIVVVGGIVAFILIAMYLPMFQMSSTFF